MSEPARGGWLPGALAVYMIPAGECAYGHPLYAIDGQVQHVLTHAEILAGDHTKLTCEGATP